MDDESVAIIRDIPFEDIQPDRGDNLRITANLRSSFVSYFETTLRNVDQYMITSIEQLVAIVAGRTHGLRNTKDLRIEIKQRILADIRSSKLVWLDGILKTSPFVRSDITDVLIKLHIDRFFIEKVFTNKEYNDLISYLNRLRAISRY